MSRRSELLFRRLPRAIWRASAWRDLHVVEDVSYGPDPAHRLDVLVPSDAEPGLPLVLHIHGGAFRVLSKETHGYVAARYARAGHVVLNVDYRLAPDHPYPAAVQDVHRALAWATEHGEDLGADTDRIVLTGESAGANLALGLALSTVLDRDEPWAASVRQAPLAAVHAVCGFLQASDTARYGRELPVSPLVARRLPIIEEDYLEGADAEVPRDYVDPLCILEALPPERARRLPPILAVCGDKDPILDDTQRLIRALREAEADVEACWVRGAGHGFHALPGRRSERAWEAIEAHLHERVGASAERRAG